MQFGGTIQTKMCSSKNIKPDNHRLKLPARPGTALALDLSGLTLALAEARAAPALAAAYPGRWAHMGLMLRTVLILLILLVPDLLSAEPPTSAHRKAIKQAETLGLAIYNQDLIAAQATDALLATVDSEDLSNVKGWIVDSRRRKSSVQFIEQRGDLYYASFDVVLKRNTAPIVSAVEPPRELAGSDLAQFLARQSALRELTRTCSDSYNTIVLNGDLVDHDGWLVYLLAATTSPNTVLAGGHYRVLVSADGTMVEEFQPLSKSCLTLQTVTDEGAPVKALFMTHILSDTPIESHVFLNLLHGLDLYVITEPGIWGLTDGSIRYAGPRPEDEEE